SVTVTNADDLNCVNDTVIMLNNSNAPTVTFTDPTNPACAGGNDGAVTVNISGGTAPYQVTIDTGGVPQTITVPIPIAQTFNGLSAGTVNVSVTDAAGCSGSASVTLTEPSPVVINGVNVTNESCAGNADGTAAISVSGGTGTYSFVWS